MGLDIIFIQEGLITFLDIIIMFVAGNNFLKKRKEHKIIRIILIVLLFILTIFFVVNVKYFYLKLILSISTITLLMNLIFDDKKINVFFHVITVIALFFIVEYILYLIIKSDTSMYTLITSKECNIFSLAILSRLIVFFIATLFINRNKYELELELDQMFKFSIVVISTILGIVSSIIPFMGTLISSNCIIISVLIFNIILIYYILSDFIKMSDKLRMQSLNKERIESELILYKELERKNTEQKKILHDYKNTLTCVKGLVYKQDYQELMSYVNSLSDNFELAEDYVSTGNTLIDVLINNKYQKAFNENITLVLKLDNLMNLIIKAEDMITILSNLLDNAIEHCMMLKNKEKQIFLKIKQKEVLRIVIKNPIETEIVVKDYLVKTTKLDDNHGIGLKSVKDIVEKYRGNIFMDVDEGYFIYLIEI